MADTTLDAGAENCGRLIDLVVEAMAPLQPGQSLAVVAYDPSSHIDLAAWCRMTGHQLRSATSEDDHLTFVIKKCRKQRRQPIGSHMSIVRQALFTSGTLATRQEHISS